MKVAKEALEEGRSKQIFRGHRHEEAATREVMMAKLN